MDNGEEHNSNKRFQKEFLFFFFIWKQENLRVSMSRRFNFEYYFSDGDDIRVCGAHYAPAEASPGPGRRVSQAVKW